MISDFSNSSRIEAQNGYAPANWDSGHRDLFYLYRRGLMPLIMAVKNAGSWTKGWCGYHLGRALVKESQQVRKFVLWFMKGIGQHDYALTASDVEDEYVLVGRVGESVTPARSSNAVPIATESKQDQGVSRSAPQTAPPRPNRDPCNMTSMPKLKSASRVASKRSSAEPAEAVAWGSYSTASQEVGVHWGGGSYSTAPGQSPGGVQWGSDSTSAPTESLLARSLREHALSGGQTLASLERFFGNGVDAAGQILSDLNSPEFEVAPHVQFVESEEGGSPENSIVLEQDERIVLDNAQVVGDYDASSAKVLFESFIRTYFDFPRFFESMHPFFSLESVASFCYAHELGQVTMTMQSKITFAHDSLGYSIEMPQVMTFDFRSCNRHLCFIGNKRPKFTVAGSSFELASFSMNAPVGEREVTFYTTCGGCYTFSIRELREYLESGHIDPDSAEMCPVEGAEQPLYERRLFEDFAMLWQKKYVEALHEESASWGAGWLAKSVVNWTAAWFDVDDKLYDAAARYHRHLACRVSAVPFVPYRVVAVEAPSYRGRLTYVGPENQIMRPELPPPLLEEFSAVDEDSHSIFGAVVDTVSYVMSDFLNLITPGSSKKSAPDFALRKGGGLAKMLEEWAPFEGDEQDVDTRRILGNAHLSPDARVDMERNNVHFPRGANWKQQLGSGEPAVWADQASNSNAYLSLREFLHARTKHHLFADFIRGIIGPEDVVSFTFCEESGVVRLFLKEERIGHMDWTRAGVKSPGQSPKSKEERDERNAVSALLGDWVDWFAKFIVNPPDVAVVVPAYLELSVREDDQALRFTGPCPVIYFGQKVKQPYVMKELFLQGEASSRDEMRFFEGFFRSLTPSGQAQEGFQPSLSLPVARQLLKGMMWNEKSD